MDNEKSRRRADLERLDRAFVEAAIPATYWALVADLVPKTDGFDELLWEQELAALVFERTGLQPTEFYRLSIAGRIPWLRRAIKKPSQTRRARRGTKLRKLRALTSAQTAAIQIVGECKGNIAEAARRLGKDRKTVEESYRTGLLKLNKTAFWNKGKTRLLPRDRRGQEVASDTDDRRRS